MYITAKYVPNKEQILDEVFVISGIITVARVIS